MGKDQVHNTGSQSPRTSSQQGDCAQGDAQARNSPSRLNPRAMPFFPAIKDSWRPSPPSTSALTPSSSTSAAKPRGQTGASLANQASPYLVPFPPLLQSPPPRKGFTSTAATQTDFFSDPAINATRTPDRQVRSADFRRGHGTDQDQPKVVKRCGHIAHERTSDWVQVPHDRERCNMCKSLNQQCVVGTDFTTSETQDKKAKEATPGPMDSPDESRPTGETSEEARSPVNGRAEVVEDNGATRQQNLPMKVGQAKKSVSAPAAEKPYEKMRPTDVFAMTEALKNDPKYAGMTAYYFSRK